jgi:hypothetical protein
MHGYKKNDANGAYNIISCRYISICHLFCKCK